jgi:hypothetical protein
MRTRILITILLLLLVVFLWNATSGEGFQDFETAASDRFNTLAAGTNPIANPAAEIGISVEKANTLRTLSDIALNSPVAVREADGTIELQEATNPIHPRIDDENSLLGMVKFCKDTGKQQNPFADAKFAANCGMCMTQGSLITGENFSKPTGVLVYEQDKKDAFQVQTDNKLIFPRVIPSVNAATCAGASKTDSAKPVLAITAKDYNAFKRRFECQAGHKIGEECAMCLNNNAYTWFPLAGGIEERSFVFYGKGLVTVQVGGETKATAVPLTEATAVTVPLGKAKERQAVKISIMTDVSGTNPFVYGSMVSKLPNAKIYKLELSRFIEKDSITNSTPRIAGSKFFLSEGRSLQKLTSAPTVEKMVLEGSLPLTFAEPNQLAVYDCPTAALVGSVESAEILVDHPCLKPKGQGPGTWSDECLRQTVLDAGCSTEGDLYRNLPPAAARNFDISAALKNLKDITVGKIGKDPLITKLCTGEDISTPCDTYLNGGVPNKACLVYLYTNQSSQSSRVGTAYPGADSRYASQDGNVPTFCRVEGTLNPERDEGQAELLKAARDGYKGKLGIEAVKQVLSDTFVRATGSLDLNKDDSQGGRKTSWTKCYGIPIADTPLKPTTVNSEGKTVEKVSSCLTSLPPSFTPLRNRNMGRIQMTTNFILSFTITPNGFVGAWANLMHFNATGWDYGWGGRAPGIWFWPNSTRFHVRICDTKDHNWGIDSSENIPLRSKSTFRLECRDREVTLTVNSKMFRATQPTSRYSGPLTVWMSNPWYPAANGLIENFCFQPL